MPMSARYLLPTAALTGQLPNLYVWLISACRLGYFSNTENTPEFLFDLLGHGHDGPDAMETDSIRVRCVSVSAGY